MELCFLEEQKTALIPLLLSITISLFSLQAFGIVLKLEFKFHVDQKIKKCIILIHLIWRLSVNVPRNGLIAIDKSFIRLHLDYGSICYETFQNKLEKVQREHALL